MKYLYSLFILLSCSLLINAQTTKWIGPGDGSWSNGANWDNGVPTSASNIVFDGSVPSLTAGVIAITDVAQSNSFGSFKSMRVINNASVSLSSSTQCYLYFTDSLSIYAGSRVNIGGTTTTTFNIGGDFSTIINIDGILDIQGQGNSSNSTNFFPTTITFGSSVVATIRGKVIMSGLNARFTSNASTPVFENGSVLEITRNGGAAPKANFKDGSIIRILGVTNSPSTINSSGIYDGVIEWNCLNQTVSGSSALILPSSSFNYIDSLVIINTGVNQSVRLSTNPSDYYVKNVIMNGGTLEFGSPGGSGVYTCKVDNIIQNGGTLIGNATGVAGFDNAFEPDTINVSGNFIQNAGIFDFSNRTPVNANPNASCVLQLGGDLKIGGTVRLSQTATASNCALIFNGTGTQNFEMTGTFSNKIRTVLNNTSIATGINAISNISLPDSLVFTLGYFWLNNFDLTNPLPVQAVPNPFQTHVVTNGTGFFIQKNVSNVPVGIPIGASTATVNPLIIAFTAAGSLDVAAKVDTGITPAFPSPEKAVNRTWQIKPIGAALSPLAVSFGYTDLMPLPGDGNTAFSYTANNEVRLFAGGNWQVISPNGGIPPAGTNPYAITHLILNSLLQPNVSSPFVVANVSSVVSVANLINLSVSKAGSSALLTWNVAELSESISRFEVLRSTDAVNYSSIGNVSAQPSQLNYSLADNQLQAGTNYYRVKMIDAAGRFKYSVVVAVINTTSGVIITSLVPTIVKSNASMMISSAIKAPVQINVTDILGRVVIKTTSILNEGSNQLNVDCSKLQAGTYQIAGYSNGIQTNIVRFVKE